MEEDENPNPFEDKDSKSKTPKTSKKSSQKKNANQKNESGENDFPGTPKTLKRRPTAKSIKKKLLKRGVTVPAISLPSSPSQTNFTGSPSPEKSSFTTETDGIKDKLRVVKSKKETKSGIENEGIKSPMRRPKLLRGMSSTKKSSAEKKKSKQKNEPSLDATVQDNSILPVSFQATGSDSQEIDYSRAIDAIRSSEQTEVIEEIARPDMTIEFGKADIDSNEYKYDIIIQEVESGLDLGPVLRVFRATLERTAKSKGHHIIFCAKSKSTEAIKSRFTKN